MVQVRSPFRVTDIPEGQVVGNHGNWLLETGSLHTVPKGRLAARRVRVGWGGGGEGWVENKGFMSLLKKRTRLGVGVHFLSPSKVFTQLGSGTAPI